ncbi:MAG: peptidoglycan DD-metalloendopeptidase family protein [Dysgonamonadaceae bacterium]|jgi:murein DD-endopeptidase MepM/ murein hydrolase activator NlpD|nr:peptidoglycan DD-metalloendopeptidase family protein [Dysgonamonadaceae bacterium]
MENRTKNICDSCLSLLGATFLVAFVSLAEANANTPPKDTPTPKAGTSTMIHPHGNENLKIEKPNTLLIAESTPTWKTSQIIDSLELEQELKKEELQYPADDIYQIWNNTSVNPYSSLAMPDSFAVELYNVAMPVDDETIKITSPFGPRRRRMHKGIDLKVQVGDTIRAAWDGTVRVKRYEKRGFGYFLILRHPNGLETVYGHLSAFLVAENQLVRAGDPIALGGNTGRSSGSHLHFETRFFGEAINPANIFDFNNKVTHEDVYVFYKNKPSDNKYTTPQGNRKVVYHRVKPGDTLSSIARKHGLTVAQLCKLNQITAKTKINTRQTLRCS